MSDRPDTFSDLNPDQQGRIRETQTALNEPTGPNALQRVQSALRKRRDRNMRWSAGLGAYVDESTGDLYVSSGEGNGMVERLTELRPEQQEMLAGGEGPSSWNRVRRRYGLGGGEEQRSQSSGGGGTALTSPDGEEPAARALRQGEGFLRTAMSQIEDWRTYTAGIQARINESLEEAGLEDRIDSSASPEQLNAILEKIRRKRGSGGRQ